MQLQVWRTVIHNPCVKSPEYITIAPVEKDTWVFPWVLPLGDAERIFGEEVVERIGEEPVPVKISLDILPEME